MGSRANLLIVDENGYEIYYCHWCANRLETDLFWGPAYAVEYIRQQQLTEEWLDERWAEGGVILDTHRRTLLLYGGEDIQHEVPLRRLYLELLELVWADWTVEWLDDGILEMADYVGLPRSIVETDDLREPPSIQFSSEWIADISKYRYVSVVGSLSSDSGTVRFFPLRGAIYSMLQHGTTIAKVLQSQQGLDSWPIQDADRFPHGGFHLDIASRKLSVWDAYAPGIVDHIQPHWPGWEIEWLKDNFEAHIAFTYNRLVLPKPAESDLLAELKEILLGRGDSSPVDGVMTLVEHIRQQGNDVMLNPNIFQYSQVLGSALRKQIFRDAVDVWQAKSQSKNP